MTNIRDNKGRFKKGMKKEDHPRYTDQASRLRVKCMYCDVEIRIKPSTYKASKSKEFYCCWDHYKADRTVYINCEVCGKEKEIKRSDLEIEGRGRFCSRSCRGKVTSKGERNNQWKGGRYKTKKGYVWIYSPNHPNKVRNHVMEHRLVMEEHIGRYLTEDEVVHHKNEITDDNRIENLQIMTPGEHTTHHNNIRWSKLNPLG